MPTWITLTTTDGRDTDVNAAHITRMTRFDGETPYTGVWTLDKNTLYVQQTPEQIKTLVREAYSSLDTYP